MTWKPDSATLVEEEWKPKSATAVEEPEPFQWHVPHSGTELIDQNFDIIDDLQIPWSYSDEIKSALPVGQKYERPGIIKRIAYGFLDKAFIQPYKNIQKYNTLGELDTLIEGLSEIQRIKEEEFREPNVEEIPAILEKAKATVEKRVQKQLPELQLPPAEGAIEKGAEIFSGIMAFVTKLAIARRFVGTGGAGAEIMSFEMVNLADNGTPGMGILLASSLGLVGKIPAATTAGKIGKTAAQGGVLASITAMEGGSPEDIAVAFLLPAVLRTLNEFPHLVKGKVFEKTIAKEVKAQGFTAKDSKAIAKSVRDAVEVKNGKMTPKQWGAKHGKNLSDIRGKYNKAIEQVSNQTQIMREAKAGAVGKRMTAEAKAKVPPKVPATKPAEAKQPWEIKQSEYRNSPWLHEELVFEAVKQNKPVPREVLEDYKYAPWAKEALAKQPAKKKVTTDKPAILMQGDNLDAFLNTANKGQIANAVQKATRTYQELRRTHPKVFETLPNLNQLYEEAPEGTQLYSAEHLRMLIGGLRNAINKIAQMGETVPADFKALPAKQPAKEALAKQPAPAAKAEKKQLTKRQKYESVVHLRKELEAKETTMAEDALNFFSSQFPEFTEKLGGKEQMRKRGSAYIIRQLDTLRQHYPEEVLKAIPETSGMLADLDQFIAEWRDLQSQLIGAREASEKAGFEYEISEESLKEQPTVKPTVKIKQQGIVDLTPLANAGEQVKTTTEKAIKGVTRFTGLEPEVKKVLIEYEEQTRILPEKIAKEAIEKFGNLTEEQERAIENYRENPKKYELPEELKSYYETLEKGIEEYGKRLEELGYPADWPNTYKKRLIKMLEREQNKKNPNQEKIDNLNQALEEAEDLRYLHHYYQKSSLGKRIIGRFRRSIKKKPTGVLGRKIPTYEKAEELGFKRAPLAVSYAHMAHEIARAEMANDLIVAINNNPNLSLPENQAPDDWVRLDERIFPASVQHQAWVEEGGPRHKRIYRKYPAPIAEALEELTYSRGNEALERAYDKLNFGLKIIGFYNPLVMSKNDAVQIWRAVGIKGFAPLVLPQIKTETGQLKIDTPKAIKIWQEKGAEYEKLRKGGLFNNVVNYTPAVTEITQQMLSHIRETSGERAARFIGEHISNPLKFISDLREINNKTTWNMDEIMRIAAYEAVKDAPILKGMTDYEKIEWVNDALVNYGKMPKSTKRWLNKAMFTPQYKVGNFRFFWGEASKAYKGQWRHLAPIVRTVAYKLFIKWGLPAITAAAILYATDEERDVRTEKGYRLVIHNPETNTDTVYALSDPLLEGAKLTQRTFRHTLALNLAPIPSLIVRVSGGPRFKQSDDPFGEFFKLGTPIYRDILNWKDPDKTIPQKILTQLAIAFIYTRRGREEDEESKIEAFAKALSIWTDWKEQAADIKKMVSGRSYYLGPGGKFGKLFREYYIEKDEDRAEIDEKLDTLISKGDYKEAMRLALESDRYETLDGISNRIIQWRAPLHYYWESMSDKDRKNFSEWLKENKHYSEKEISELVEALEKSKKEVKIKRQ